MMDNSKQREENPAEYFVECNPFMSSDLLSVHIYVSKYPGKYRKEMFQNEQWLLLMYIRSVCFTVCPVLMLSLQCYGSSANEA